MDLALVLGLITFLGWGTGDLFTIVATRKIGANLTTFWVFFFSLLLSLLVWPWAPHGWEAITWPLLGLNVFLGVLYVSGNVLISEAFRVSSAPLVGIIIQAFPAVVLVMSALVFGDVVTLRQWVFIAIIFAGVFLCSVDLGKLKRAEKLIDRGVGLALVAMVFLSVFFTFSRILIEAYGWYLPTLIATGCFPVIYLFVRYRKEKFMVPREGRVLLAVFMVGLLIRAGDFALNWGLSIPGASSLVAPVAGAAPVLFVVASSLVFKDKLTRQQVIGIVMALAGVVLLSVIG